MRPVYLIGSTQRDYAHQLIDAAEVGSVVSITGPKRTPPQNKKMWAMLRDVAEAKPEGRQWTPDTWKAAFLHACGHQVQFAEGLDGSGPFPIGFRSSQLKVAQMRDLIECMYDYGARHDVEWRETIKGGFMESNA